MILKVAMDREITYSRWQRRHGICGGGDGKDDEATEMTEAAVNLPIWAMVAECFMATLLWHK